MKTETKTETKTTKIKVAKKLITLALFVFSFANCGQTVIASEITAQKMIELTNESRKEMGLLPLKVSGELTAAAKAKADDMFELQYFDHNSPSGTTPWYWIRSAGYDYLYAGENLAIDFVTAEGTHIALMRSITHRDNILKPNYTEIGIAVKKGIFDGNESVIVVEHFGSPLKKENRKEDADKDKFAIKGDYAVRLRKGEQEIKTENKEAENKQEEAETKLVELESPIIYFKDENYEKEEEDLKNKSGEKIENEEAAVKEIAVQEENVEEKNMEFAFPTMFPIENLKLLDRNFTENIFWNNYEKKERGIFDEIIFFFNYKFLRLPK